MTGSGEALSGHCCYIQRMTTHTSPHADTPSRVGSQLASALSDRLEQGVQALTAFASALSDAEWQTRVPHDGRTVGVVVHHVASVYPLEIQLAMTVADGKPITGVKVAAVELLQKNGLAAAAAIRALTDAQLAQAALVSLYADAPLTCQFVLEDHAVRHSYHHLARLRQTVGR